MFSLIALLLVAFAAVAPIGAAEEADTPPLSFVEDWTLGDYLQLLSSVSGLGLALYLAIRTNWGNLGKIDQATSAAVGAYASEAQNVEQLAKIIDSVGYQQRQTFESAVKLLEAFAKLTPAQTDDRVAALLRNALDAQPVDKTTGISADGESPQQK